MGKRYETEISVEIEPLKIMPGGVRLGLRVICGDQVRVIATKWLRTAESVTATFTARVDGDR